MSASGGIVLQNYFSTPARKIDSRSYSQPQHRFKSARSRIRSNPIPQSWIGDFCNKIGCEAVVSQTSAEVGV